MQIPNYLSTPLRTGQVCLFIALATIFLGTSARSGDIAVNPLISYQGRLTQTASGAAVNGTVTLVFRLYTVAEGGTALWTEIKDVTVHQGLFTTQLGDTTALPGAIFNGQELWLGIKVGTDPEASPRQQLYAVAYALYSNNANLLDGMNSTDFAPAAHSHDAEYHSQSEADARFVNVTGDAMSATSVAPVLSVTQAGTGLGGRFTSTSSHAVSGETTSTSTGVAGVHGSAGLSGVTITGQHGVLGQSQSGRGVVGTSRDGNGVYGSSVNTWALRGEGQYGGLYALSFGAGSDAIRGENSATSGSSWGVVGTSASPSGRGVAGFNSATTGTAEGVYGSSSSSTGRGVSGMTLATSGATYGVYGQSSSANNGAGVRGQGPYVGVWGAATSTSGVNWGVYGQTSSTAGYGGYFSAAAGGVAGRFIGNVQISGSLSKSSGSFVIDHPLDPENKYLYHSFVESPDMMNVYNGVASLDADGAAWVELPAYFEALNRDYRYQLTPIGGPGPNLHIAQEVQGNRFQIAGGSPGKRVSWQVTGIRQDPYALANPIVAEVNKPAGEQGTLLHPEAHGRNSSHGLDAKLLHAPTHHSAADNPTVAVAQADLADGNK